MKTIKLKFTDEEEEFTLLPEFAYKDGEAFDIFSSEMAYTVDMYMGKMRAIVDSGCVN